MSGNPTLYDVAREAGVSLATASRTLNGSTRRVKDEYRERVHAAAAKLGYTPNLPAQAVARGGSATVALLVSDIADPYFSGIAAGVARAASGAGLAVTIAVTERDAQRELDLVRVLRGQRPRVIVLAGSRSVDEPLRDTLVEELSAFEATGGRVVVVGATDLPFGTVSIADADGARALATELLNLGYRRFAVLAGPEHLVTARTRTEAFASALPERPRIVHGDFTRDGGFAATSTLVREGALGGDGTDGIQALFAVNDLMAIGALAALRDEGLGARVAVAGFDDIPTARDVTPPLTTVLVDVESAGAAAVEIALGARDAAAIPTRVVLRASTPAR